MIHPTFTVEQGIKALQNFAKLRQIAEALSKDRSSAKAGILGDAATAQHGDDGVSNIDVALWNEFGTDHIPARSFIRAPFAANVAKYRQYISVLTPKILEGAITAEKALKTVGMAMASDMRKAIVSGEGIPPPNAPSTIKAKGSSRPLVGESGQLKNSITYVVDVPEAAK